MYRSVPTNIADIQRVDNGWIVTLHSSMTEIKVCVCWEEVVKAITEHAMWKDAGGFTTYRR